MKKFFNPLTIYLIIFGLMFFWPIFASIFDSLTEAGLNPFDYARITHVDYKARLLDEPGEGGNLAVTERLTFDIHAAFRSNTFWELWRDLCEDDVDGLPVRYSVKSVAEILPNGQRVVYPESSKLYWYDSDYTNTLGGYGPGKWYHSPGPYNEEYDRYECVFFYIDGVYRQKMNFEIEYEMTNAALRYGDCSELYVSMFSEGAVNHLESFNAEILIANKDMPKEGNYYVNTYGTEKYSFPYTESTTINPGYHTFSMSLDKDDLKFNPATEYIEFDLVSYGDDYHSFTDNAKINHYYSDPVLEELKDEHEDYVNEANIRKTSKFCLLLISFFFAYVIVKKLLNADNTIEEKYQFYKPEIDYDFFREIPSNLDPSFAADLVFCKDKKIKDKQDVLAAILLSLVRKKYVEVVKIDSLKDWDNSNVKIIVRYKPRPTVFVPPIYNPNPEVITVEQEVLEQVEPQEELEPLTETEKLYFNLITRHAISGEVTMTIFEQRMTKDYDYTDTFIRGMDNSTINVGVSQKYFQKANYKQAYNALSGQSVMYYFLAFLVLIFGNMFAYQSGLGLAYGAFIVLGASLLFGGIHLGNMAHNYILLTQFGEDEYAKWRGLYNFLNSDTLMNEKNVPDLVLWEQYLVYATAFGISEKVIKALEIAEPTLMETSPVLNNPYYRSRSFYVSSRSFRSSARTTSSFARSGGYGYGGGGRGGGGGGGGH